MRLWCINPAFTAYFVSILSDSRCNGKKVWTQHSIARQNVDTSIICVSLYDRIYLICTCWMIGDVYHCVQVCFFFSTVLELKQVLRWIKNIHQAHQIGCHCCYACTFIDQRGFQMFAYVNLQMFFFSFKSKNNTKNLKGRKHTERFWCFLSTHKTPYFHFIFHC